MLSEEQKLELRVFNKSVMLFQPSKRKRFFGVTQYQMPNGEILEHDMFLHDIRAYRLGDN